MVFRGDDFKKYEGTRISDYDVKKLIGVGGMGAVFLAENPFMKIKVALKVLLPEYSVDESFVERFFREARNAHQLKHQNAAQVFHAGRDEASNLVFMAMELVAGSTLKRIMKNGRIWKYKMR